MTILMHNEGHFPPNSLALCDASGVVCVLGPEDRRATESGGEDWEQGSAGAGNC